MSALALLAVVLVMGGVLMLAAVAVAGVLDWLHGRRW